MGRQCRNFDYITPILHDEKNNFVGEHPEKVVILKLQVAESANLIAELVKLIAELGCWVEKER